MDLTTVPDVEIARVGTHQLSSGPFTFTREHLASAVERARTGAAAVLGIGHIDKRFDGEPSLGRWSNLRVAEDGDTLLGDAIDVPKWLAKVMPSGFPRRSLEAKHGVDDDGRQWMHLDAVKLLGMTVPGIRSLKDIETRFSEAGPLLMASGEDAHGVSVSVIFASDEASEAALVASVQADPRPDRTHKEDTMDVDLTLLRKRLGLADDATEDQIKEALAATPTVEPAGLTEEQANERVETAVAAARAEERDKITASGGKVIDAATYDALREDAAAGRQAREEQITASRADYVGSAIRTGKFPPARREHFISLMAKDEEGTRAYIDSLEPGAIPVGDEVGITASSESESSISLPDELPQSLSLLSPAERALRA